MTTDNNPASKCAAAKDTQTKSIFLVSDARLAPLIKETPSNTKYVIGISKSSVICSWFIVIWIKVNATDAIGNANILGKTNLIGSIIAIDPIKISSPAMLLAS